MPPTRDKPDVVLHVGTGKTGTTSIQNLLRLNRDVLGERGILYPRSPGRGRHVKLGLSFRSDDEYESMPAWHQMRARSPERFRRRFHRRLLDELEKVGPRRVVFSDEALYTLPVDGLLRLRTFLAEHFGATHVIVYLRRQDDHLVSYYQQQVKVGETRRLAEFAEDPGYPYDYDQRLGELRAALEPTSMTVRLFERGRFVGGRLEDDFLRAAGIDGRGLEHADAVRNRSLDAASVEFLRLYNLHQVAHSEDTVGVIDHRDLVRRLSADATGAQLTLPDAVLERFMAAWEASNRSVADWCLGGTELFAEPRRRSSVTEIQELEASELERMMATADLPADVRDRMRRLADRESSGRR